jgi:hypothetical protein
MQKFLMVALVALLLSGCGAVPARDRNVLMGSAAGAGVGALVGWAVGGPSTGWVGAAVGGAVGGVIGYLVRPDGCFIQNKRGELWQVSCDDLPVRAVGCYVGNEIGGLREVDCPRRWQQRVHTAKAGSKP